jgi:hypothetical protein
MAKIAHPNEDHDTLYGETVGKINDNSQVGAFKPLPTLAPKPKPQT